MQITLCGASGGEVTGSCYLVETAKAKVVVDCGMFQGHGHNDDPTNRDFGPMNPAQLTAAVLSHAHLDHCGRFPLLARRGLNCPIYATPATVDFATLILEDSTKIQEADNARDNRYRRIEGRPLIEPLYDRADAAGLIPLVRAVPYNQLREIAQGISIRFIDAGHILGSASIEMLIEEDGQRRRVLFSADVGRWGVPLLRDPTPFEGAADLLFLESTYGDRDHRSNEETVAEFQQVIHDAVWAREKILIPAFALGRTQQILYHLAEMMRGGKMPEFPIFLDSPMAIKATELYIKHQALFDAEASELAGRRQISLDLRNLRYLQTGEESRSLNDLEGCAVIIAGGGMCDGGRIVHHLKHNLWRKGVSVVMVGYAARGSLGRKLIDGWKEVQIHRQMIPVRATIHTLGGFSGHAGQNELLRWFEPLAQFKPRVMLTHGEDPQRTKLAAKLKEKYAIEAELPAKYQVVTL